MAVPPQQIREEKAKGRGALFYSEIIVPIVVIIVLILVGGLLWNWWGSQESVQEGAVAEPPIEQVLEPEIEGEEEEEEEVTPLALYPETLSFDSIVASNDESQCFTFADPDKELRLRCVSEIIQNKGDEGMCESLPFGSEDANECYTYLGVIKGDVGFCSRLVDAEGYEFTKGPCTYLVAESEGNASICEGFDDPEDVESCLLSLAGALGDVTICESVGDDDKEYCLTKVAAHNNDMGICDALSGEARDYCYVYLAKVNADVAICNKITTETGYASKDNCLFKVALEKEDISLCHQISYADGFFGQYDCYKQHAMFIGDQSVCENIPVPDDEVVVVSRFSRDACYYEYAVYNKDWQACYWLSNYSHEYGAEYPFSDCLLGSEHTLPSVIV
jgi:hypothetical protein